MGAGDTRWRGQPGRVEVWYATFTGGWIHYELVSPASDADGAYGHGWVAMFPPGRAPAVARFGPSSVLVGSEPWFAAGPYRADAGTLAGDTWSLTYTTDAPPLWTFPRWA